MALMKSLSPFRAIYFLLNGECKRHKYVLRASAHLHTHTGKQDTKGTEWNASEGLYIDFDVYENETTGKTIKFVFQYKFGWKQKN